MNSTKIIESLEDFINLIGHKINRNINHILEMRVYLLFMVDKN